MYSPILLLLLTTAVVVGADSSPQLLRRQIVSQLPCSSQGMKECGEVCIDMTATCCPDRAGGCPSGSYCILGWNGDYGCCDNGELCEGPGGAFTTPGDTATSTRTEVTTVTSELTEDLPIETSISTLTSTFVSTIISTSVSTVTSTSIPTPISTSSPLSVSHSSTQSSNLASEVPTSTTSLPEFTGAADSGVHVDLSVRLLAFILPFMVV
jgi:hypothetical protein